MTKYKVFLTQTLEKKLEGTEKPFKEWFEKITDQLAENPFVGKPLSVKWFREKKFKKYRAYYLIYENLNSVYVVNLSDKKNQQKTINSIMLLLNVYKEEIRKLLD